MDSSLFELVRRVRADTDERLRVGTPLLVLCVASLFLLEGSLTAAQVRLREGTMVRLKLLYNVTTDNVVRGDRVEFDVAENVVANDRVVIEKGALAWGQVTDVKGAGKKKAKDASVTFRLMAANTVDKQQVSLRVKPTKPKKSDSRDNEIEENSLIPGMNERTIGAEKGRDYAAYTDQDVLVNAPDVKKNDEKGPPPPPPPPPPPEEAYVDFNSTPPGAEVMIDNRFCGSTPMRIPLPPGRHLIEIRLAGHRTWMRNMIVDPGSKPSVRATLDQE